MTRAEIGDPVEHRHALDAGAAPDIVGQRRFPAPRCHARRSFGEHLKSVLRAPRHDLTPLGEDRVDSESVRRLNGFADQEVMGPQSKKGWYPVPPPRAR